MVLRRITRLGKNSWGRICSADLLHAIFLHLDGCAQGANLLIDFLYLGEILVAFPLVSLGFFSFPFVVLQRLHRLVLLELMSLSLLGCPGAQTFFQTVVVVLLNATLFMIIGLFIKVYLFLIVATVLLVVLWKFDGLLNVNIVILRFLLSLRRVEAVRAAGETGLKFARSLGLRLPEPH